MKYRVKIEQFYEVEAESIEQIESWLADGGYVYNVHFDFAGEDAYAEEIKPAGTPHDYKQLDY